MPSLADCLKLLTAEEAKAELFALAEQYGGDEAAHRRAAAELLEGAMDDMDTVRSHLQGRGFDVAPREERGLSPAEIMVQEAIAVRDNMRQVLEARGQGHTLDESWGIATRMARFLAPKGDPLGFVQKLNFAADIVGKRAESVAALQQGGQPLIRLTENVDPSTLLFREEMQNNVEGVGAAFPEGLGYYPVTAARQEDGGLLILDGHNRVTVARDRGDQIPVVELPNWVYRQLLDEGYDELEISYAMLDRVGANEAASALDNQFPGADIGRRGWEADDRIDELFEAQGLNQISPEAQALQQDAADPRTLYQPLSTRVPYSVNPGEDAMGDLLVVDYDRALQDKASFEKNVATLLNMPNMRKLTGKGSRTPKVQAEAFIDHVVENLLFLFDNAPESIRERGRLWYDGGNRIVKEWASRYGISEMQAAGSLAVLSPQKDWFQNVSQAERLMDIYFGMREFQWDDAMEAEFVSLPDKVKAQPAWTDVKGKKLGEILDDPALAARWIRVFDQTHNSRNYRILTPEGGTSDFATTQGGAPRTSAWGSFNEIAKGVSALNDGTALNVHYQIGNMHKVRNFYNNLFDPNSDKGFATIDTHAVAAALLRPLSGNDVEVLQAFGGAGSSSNAESGMRGTYPIYLEAYRRAAEQRGVLPRQMQSITWEAVRGLFEASQKKGMKAKADGIWTKYKNGEIEADQARAEIMELAGGVTDPSWVSVPYTDQVSRTYEGLSQKTVDEMPEKPSVMFEVAPHPGDASLVAAWSTLSQTERIDATQKVVRTIVPEVLKEFKTAGHFSYSFGGYMGMTSPSVTMALADPQKLPDVARALGYILSQESVAVASEKPVPGAEPSGAVIIHLPEGYGAKEIDALYGKLWELEHNGEKLIGGHTTANGTMTVLNFTALDTAALADMIQEHIGEGFDVQDNEIYSAFIGEEDYGYGTNQRETFTGRTPIQERVHTLRAEASRILQEAIDAREGTTLFQSAPVRGRGPQILRASDVGPVRASYGEQTPGGRSVVGIHYSSEPRESLSGHFYGSGIKGAEAKRLDLSDDPRLKKRIHFYVDRGQGIRPEPGVGANIHAVNLNNLYDISEDPLGLEAAAYADKMADPAVAFNNLETSILDAGFDGILVPNAQTNNGVAVLLGEQHTNVPVDLVQPPQGSQAASVAPAAPSAPSVSARVIQEPDGSQRLMYTDMDSGRVAGSVVIRDGAVVDTEIRAAFAGKGFEQAIAQDLQLRGVDAGALLQDQPDGARGAYNQLQDGQHLIRLFEQANASTMPHELAHAFLTEIRTMVQAGAADPDLVADLDKIESWLDREAVEGSPEWQSYYEAALAKGMDEDQARENATFVLRHEKFSRGFEKYLWEGKAPEPELEGIFARFSRWLKQIYQDAVSFGVELDPEIRSVFDRMMKAESEVDAKVMELGFTPMTQALAKHLGLGPEDRDYAVRLYSAAMEKAEAALVQARNKGLKKLRAEWKKDAVEEAKQSPVHQMLYMLRKGRGINKDEFLALYGDEAAKGLPHGVLRKDGLSLNELAFEHNYDSHEQMVNDLWNYRKPEEIAADVVEQKTAERDATFKVEDFILETKEFGAYQELMAKAYDKDGNVLSNKAFRDYARKIVASMPLADAMDVRGFLAAMGRHHKAETKALKAGNLAEASKANKKARLNQAYAQEALQVRKRVEKIERLAKRLGKLKAGKIEEGHHHALLQLLTRFGLTKKDFSRLQDVPALAELTKLEDAFGADEEAAFSAWLLSGESRSYKDLTSGEFEELSDLMKFLYGRGKDLIKPTLKATGVDFDEMKDTLLTGMEKLPARGKRAKEGTLRRWAQDRVSSYLSNNRTLLWIIRELDGYTSLKGKAGPLERLLIDPLEAAQVKEADLKRKVAKRTAKARARLLRSAQARSGKVSLIDLPVPPAWQRSGRVWDFDACLSLIMNMGNSVNRQRIMDGYNLTEEDLQRVMALFSKEDALAVQDIWDAMDEILWPEIADTHKNLRFFTPAKVEAEAFTMPDGTIMRGGYYPLKYDPSADTRAARNQDLDKAVENPATAFLPKSVASGATKARAASAGGMPVMLRTSVLSGHLEWAAHYASHAAVIHDLGKILGDRELAEAIKTRVGEDTYRVANELVKRIANPRAGDVPNFLEKLAGKLTGASAVYTMWLNRFGPLTQPTAIGNYITAEGGWGKGTATWLKGAAHFLSNPGTSWAWLMENNPALAEHFTLVRRQLSTHIRDDFQDIQLGRTKGGRAVSATRETIIRGGIALYGLADAVVSVPGWYGSYLRGMEETGDHAASIVRANKIMAEYTPMSRQMDKTLFQHSKGLARAWTYMMSFFTKAQNTNAGYWKAWRQGAINTDQLIGHLVAAQILPSLVVSMMYTLLTGDDDEREDILLDAGIETVAYQFSGLPMAREITAFAANGVRAGITGDMSKMRRNAFQMPGMTVLKLMEYAGRSTVTLAQDFDDDDKQAKAALALADLVFLGVGFPAPKVVREVQKGLEDIDDDEGNILNVLIKPKYRRRD